eukprot:CAMPEP_0197930336 /NCGR_PEP_ID=MMETSP1439-20131203/105304_1 /TAXON_ID=66791 /ORGANISM="Gonyaulax spinifera, Strain CCMP409" /LENGTH=117 /DNA_ID=CAMNT_0043553025 /DNA_START=3 /DNA_END=353 /DNA_ORIENTATION=+
MTQTKLFLAAKGRGEGKELHLDRTRGGTTRRDQPAKDKVNMYVLEQMVRRNSDITNNEVLQAEKHHRGRAPACLQRWKAQEAPTSHRWEEDSSTYRSTYSDMGRHQGFDTSKISMAK